MNKLIVCVFLLILSASSVFAKSIQIDGTLSKCSKTASIIDEEFIPAKFHSTNNLTRKIGGFGKAQGRVINIYGRLLDKNCIPVSDANIYIWQTNSLGIYQSPGVKVFDIDKEKIDPNFTGSGVSTTNNQGHFSFITIFPDELPTSAPHINFMVSHPDFKIFQSRIYFNSSSEDVFFKKVDEAARKSLIAIKADMDDVYLFDIILDDIVKNRRF
jgi:protocatechuate 3,4-dioxygenase beta subunit